MLCGLFGPRGASPRQSPLPGAITLVIIILIMIIMIVIIVTIIFIIIVVVAIITIILIIAVSREYIKAHYSTLQLQYSYSTLQYCSTFQYVTMTYRTDQRHLHDFENLHKIRYCSPTCSRTYVRACSIIYIYIYIYIYI